MSSSPSRASTQTPSTFTGEDAADGSPANGRSPAPRRRASISEQLPLVPTMLVLALAELITHRIALTALEPGLLEDVSSSYRLFATYSPFFYHAACLVAVASLAWVLVETTKDRLIAPLPWRVVLGLTFCAFLPMASVGSMVASSLDVTPYASVKRLLPYLNITFILVVLVILAMSWTRNLDSRFRLTLLFFAVPLIMLAIFQHRILMWTVPKPKPQAFEQIRKASFLSEYGAFIAAMAGYWAIFLLAPVRRRPPRGSPGPGEGQGEPQGANTGPHHRQAEEKIAAEDASAAALTGGSAPRNAALGGASENLKGLFGSLKERFSGVLICLTHPIALIAGLAVVATLGTLIKTRFTLGQRLVETAMGVALPAPSFSSLLFMGSLFLLVVLLVSLALTGREERMMSAGIALMTLGGYRLNEPLAYLLAALGLLALYKGSVAVREREDPTPQSTYGPPLLDKRWRAYMQVLTHHLSSIQEEIDLDNAILMTRGYGVSRIFGEWFGTTLDVRFVRRHRRLIGAEVTLGEVPSSTPDWSIRRRHKAASMSLNPLQLNDTEGHDPLAGAEAAFKMHFHLQDREGMSHRILKAPDHLEAVGRIFGKVSLWWGIGVKHWMDVEAMNQHSLIDPQTPSHIRLPVPIGELVESEETPPSPGELPSIIALLTQWANRAGVAAEPEVSSEKDDGDESKNKGGTLGAKSADPKLDLQE